MRSRRRSVVLAFVLALPVFLGGDAGAVADYRVRMRATIELGGGPLAAGLLQVYDYSDYDVITGDTPEFPSFVFPESAITGSAATRRATIDIANTASAVFLTTDTDPELAAGHTTAAVLFGIANPTTFSWMLDVRVTGFFEYRGGVHSGLGEVAETDFVLSFTGRTPDGSSSLLIASATTSTRDVVGPASGPQGFDLTTSTAFLGVPETYTFLIPPSHQGSEFVVYDIGISGQVSGRAVSRYDGASPAILDDVPEGPPPPDPADLPFPAFDGPPVVACVPFAPARKRKSKLRFPRGLHRLVAGDPSDADPLIYVSDQAGSGPFGPFHSGDVVRMQRAADGEAGAFYVKAPRSPVRAHLRLLGDAVITAIDAQGDSAKIICPLKHKPEDDGGGQDPPPPTD